MAEKLEELQLPRAQVEIESRGAIYAVPFFEDTDLGKPSQSPEDALGPGARHPPLATSVSSGHPTSASPFPTALAIPEAGVPLSCGAKLGSSSPVEENGGTGTAGCGLSHTGRSSSCCGGARAGTQRAATEWRCQGHKALQRYMRVPGSPQLSPSLPWRQHPCPGHQCLGVGLCSGMGTSACPSAGVQHTGSVLDQGLAARETGEESWQLEGHEARCSAEGLSMAPTTGKPGLGLAMARSELRQPCRFRGVSATQARGHFHLPAHLCASKIGSTGRHCWCPQPRGLAGSWRRPLTAFLPCPLQRRIREQRRAEVLAAHRRRALVEGKTPASPWSQRDLPLPQQVTRSLMRAFLGRPAPSPPHSAPIVRGKPWGGRPSLPALGHLGTV